MRFPSYGRSGGLIGALLLAGCSGGGDPTATLQVSLMDAPVDAAQEVRVEIAAMWLKPAGDGPAVSLTMPQAPMRLDLLTLGEANAAILVDGAAIEPGEYEWLAMDVNAELDGIYDSYVMTDVGGQEELRVPSGRVRLVSGFTVEANQAVRLLFDWDLRRGLVDPPGLPGFLLKPAFRVIDVTEYGALRGTVAATTIGAANCTNDDPDPTVGNVVYIYEGPNAAVDDVDGTDPQPIATAAVAQDQDGVYVYRAILAPGQYTVAFTCVAAGDDPQTDDALELGAPVEVTVTADATATVDF